MTTYYRLKNGIIKRQISLVLAFCFIWIALLAAYGLGRVHGWDRGTQSERQAIAQALAEGIADGHTFYLKDMECRFEPHQDNAVNIIKKGKGKI